MEIREHSPPPINIAPDPLDISGGHHDLLAEIMHFSALIERLPSSLDSEVI